MLDVIGKHTTLEFVPADSGAYLDDDGAFRVGTNFKVKESMGEWNLNILFWTRVRKHGRYRLFW